MRDKFTTSDTHTEAEALYQAICEEAEQHMSFLSWVIFQNTPFVELEDRSLNDLYDEADTAGLQKVLDLIHEAETDPNTVTASADVDEPATV